MSPKPARTLTFKCKKCNKPVTLYLQKVSACSHITPYQGFCKCGEMMRHATGDKDAVASFVESNDIHWAHHHHPSLSDGLFRPRCGRRPCASWTE